MSNGTTLHPRWLSILASFSFPSTYSTLLPYLFLCSFPSFFLSLPFHLLPPFPLHLSISLILSFLKSFFHSSPLYLPRSLLPQLFLSFLFLFFLTSPSSFFPHLFLSFFTCNVTFWETSLTSSRDLEEHSPVWNNRNAVTEHVSLFSKEVPSFIFLHIIVPTIKCWPSREAETLVLYSVGYMITKIYFLQQLQIHTTSMWKPGVTSMRAW